jgi:hypothetical protein
MKRAAITMLFALAVPLFALAPSHAVAENTSMATKHPVEVEAPAICSQCHTDWRATVDHTPEFGKLRHKFSAMQYAQACGLCHTEAFCSDCHAHKETIKPSDKYKDSPERALPHRGDYLNQHMIDGRVNPTSCMKCHGRQNNERCLACHR